LPESASEEAARQGNSAVSARAKSFIFLFYVQATPNGHSEGCAPDIAVRFVL
jgi:hypothetical protein